MKRAVFLAATAVLLLALGVVVFAEIPAKTGMPAVAQARLNQYLAYAYPSGGASVKAIARARRPWAFSQALSGSAYGDSVYFQTDTGPTWTETDNLRPLPYPPKELWCVRLDPEAGESEAAPTVVFVALHMDIYNADWLVHTGRQGPATPAGQNALSAVGCDPR